ncbi:hypothetical protein Tco_0785768, partial [Tanacetum coccineum]
MAFSRIAKVYKRWGRVEGDVFGVKGTVNEVAGKGQGRWVLAGKFELLCVYKCRVKFSGLAKEAPQHVYSCCSESPLWYGRLLDLAGLVLKVVCLYYTHSPKGLTGLIVKG